MMIRTLSQLQARIARRGQRLDMICNQPGMSDEAKKTVERMELEVIESLRGQLRNRVNWYMKCCGC